MNDSTYTSNKYGIMVGIAIVIAFLLPHTNVVFLLANPLLCLLFLCFSNKRKSIVYSLYFVIPVFVSLLINIQDIQLKSFLSISSILLFFLSFPFVGRIRVKNTFLYFCLFVIILSQLVYLIGIPFLINIFDTVYPLSDNSTGLITESTRENASWETMMDYRLGGIYHNPNICAEFVSFLLTFYLLNNRNHSGKSIYVFSALAFCSVLLTGSRTGFVVSFMVLAIYYFKNKKNSAPSGIIGALSLLLLIVYVSSTNIRSLNMERGMEGSANLKLITFLYYLTNEDSIFRLFIGYVDPKTFKGGYYTMNQFDSDYGYIIYCYGFIGFIGLLLFFWKIWGKVDKNCMIFFILLLWMFTATIITSYRALFAYMLLLSVIYSNYKVSADKCDNYKNLISPKDENDT